MAQEANASPMAVIHSSYYAMFHAVRDLDDALRTAGRAFNEIKDERTAADYDETIVPSPEDAREALQAANDFKVVCGERFALRTSSSTAPT